jgi:hypothetical protein
MFWLPQGISKSTPGIEKKSQEQDRRGDTVEMKALKKHIMPHESIF